MKARTAQYNDNGLFHTIRTIRSFFSVLSAVILLAACRGNGGSAYSGGPTYVPGGGSGGSSGGNTTGDSTNSFTAQDLLNLSNAGDAVRMIELFQTAATGETCTVVMTAEALGLPAGGSVTLTITGSGISYTADATADADGNVYFEVPLLESKTTVTVGLIVKDANGTALYAGSEEQEVDSTGNLHVGLVRQFWTLPASLTVTASPALILYNPASWTSDAVTFSITNLTGAPAGAAITFEWTDEGGNPVTPVAANGSITRTVSELLGGTAPSVTTATSFSVTASYTDASGTAKTAAGTVSVTVAVGFAAAADKAILTAGSSTAGDNAATITAIGAPAGSISVTPVGTAASLLTVTPLSASSWNVTIASTGSGEVWFADDTAADVTVTDGSNTETIHFTLKNKYRYTLKNHVGDGGTLVYGPEEAGYELTFANAKSIVSAYSTPIPAGREIILFEDTVTGTVYKETDFPITFNSTNFSTRLIRLKAVLDFAISAKDAVNAPWTGATSFTNVSSQTGMMYTLEKYSNTTKKLNISLSDYSDLANLSGPTASAGASTYLDIGTLSASGGFTVSLKDTVTHDSIPATGYTYTITITDNGTNATKYIHVKVAQPGEYKYSLYYQTGSGASATNVAITGCQDMVFEPNERITFGVPDATYTSGTLTMGDLISTLTGLEASIRITGWTGTGPNGNSLNYTTPYPNVGAGDCTDNAITLIAKTDFGALMSAYRQDENSVATGDIVLSNGKVLDKNSTFAINRSSLYSSYRIGTVCVWSGNRKFVVAKNLSSNCNMKWSNSQTNTSLGVTISGTHNSDYTAAAPVYDATSALTFSPDGSGKNSASSVSINTYPAFKFCADYGSSTSLPSGTITDYTSGWYLPSIAEAYELYKQGVITNKWIVSSSQFNQEKYWLLIGNENKVKAWPKTDEDNRSKIYPCHDFTFVEP